MNGDRNRRSAANRACYARPRQGGDMAADDGPDQVSKNFGLVIAFVVPGFIGLWALSYFDATTAKWLGVAAEKETTVGGFLFVLVASIGVGVFLSGIRHLFFDRFLLKDLGRPPQLDQKKRKDLEGPYQSLKEDHYRFYQFYSNTAVALPIAFLFWVVTQSPAQARAIVVGVVLLMAVAILYVSARHCLARYREKQRDLLGIAAAPGTNK